MIEYTNQSLLERLQKLYTKEEAQKTLQEIEKLFSEYRPLINSSAHRMAEDDVILITYGDSIKKDGQKHLKTLARFLCANLSM